MFKECSSLKELNINNFGTSKVTDFNCMFQRCHDDLKKKINDKFKI